MNNPHSSIGRFAAFLSSIFKRSPVESEGYPTRLLSPARAARPSAISPRSPVKCEAYFTGPSSAAPRPQPSFAREGQSLLHWAAIGRAAASLSAFQNFRFSAFFFAFALFLVFAATGWGQTAQSLPYSYTSGVSSMTPANGWYQTGIGGDYADSTTKIKFDGQNDVATLRVSSSPGTITFYLKGNSFSGGTFRLLQSSDNSTFTTVNTYTTAITGSNVQFTESLNSATRWIRWLYVAKSSGNVGMGTIAIAAAAAATAPTVTTNSTVTSITSTGATLGGNITNINGANANVRGFEYSTSSGFGNGTGTNSTDSGDYGNGTFTKAVSSLTANTLYYFKAKAQNSAGTGWGAEASFTTLPLPPTVGTGSSANATGFTANWSLLTMGSATHNFTVEVSTNNSTFASPTTVTGILSGNTSQAITGLSPSTTYYYRIKSVNAQGDSEWSSGSADIATSAAAGPVLTAATLASALTATYPSASSGVSFTAAGTNLTANITVTAQAGYEVSTSSGSGYGASVSVATGTTVWVRFAASRAAGNYNSATAAVLSSTGAANVNVTTSSSGNTISKATPTVSVAPTASAITYGQTLASSTLSGGTASVAGSFAFTTPATAPAAGTASQGVTFTPTDGTNYNTASTTASVTVNKATPTLVFNSANSTTIDGTVTLNATSASTGAVTYTSSNNAVVSIASDVATGVAIGTATITASQAADSNYNAATANQTMTVTAAPVVLAGWDFAGLSAYGSSPQTANTTASGVTIGGLTRNGFTTSGTAASNAWGGVGNGNATFTVKANAGYTINLSQIPTYNVRRSSAGATTGQWAYSTDGTNFTNIGSAITWGSVTTSAGNTQSAINLSDILPLQNLDSSTTVTFRISNTGATTGTWYLNNSTASDDFTVTGLVTQLPPTVTAATINGTVGTPLSANITATNSPTGYAISSGTLPAGLSLNATTGEISGTPTEAVSSSVVAVTATNGGGTSAAANLTFNIAQGSQSITFGALSSKTYGDSTFSLTATASSGLSVSYASSNTSVATVAGSTVTVVGVGSTTITASQSGNANFSAAANVNQSLTVNPKALTGSFTANNKTFDGTTSAAVATRAVDGKVGSDDVNHTGGTATFANAAVGNGKTVTLAGATLTGSKAANYSLSSVSTTTANITQATPTITTPPTASTITSGQALSDSILSGGASSVAGAFAFTAPGTVPSPGIASQGVTFTPTDSGNYTTQTTSVDVGVLCLAPTFSQATLPISTGFTVNWNAATGAANYTVLHSASKNMTGATSVNTASTTLALTGLSEGLRFVQVRANNAAGASANSTTQVNQLQSVAAGATKYVSLASAPSAQTVAGIFGSANESGLAAGATDSVATTILLLNSNGSTANTIFYDTDVNEWREGPTDRGSTAIAAGKAFILKNNTGSTDYFLLAGTPRDSQPVVSLSSAGNFTLLTTGRTTETPLTSLNLNPGTGAGQFKASSKPSGGDRLIVPPANSTDPVTTYWYHTTSGQWYDGLTPVPSAGIPAGQGFFIKRASDSTFDSWTMPAE